MARKIGVPTVYLASPYSHEDEEVRLYRFNAACKAASKIMSKTVVVYSPIAHSHSIALYNHEMSWDFWFVQSMEMLSRCDSLVVLCLDGWEESTGVTEERDFAKNHHMPIEYIDPRDLGIE